MNIDVLVKTAAPPSAVKAEGLPTVHPRERDPLSPWFEIKTCGNIHLQEDQR